MKRNMKKGFTLIELSIVLIIIGLIIGGVMKGKDLINSADQKKVYNTWVKEWVTAANEYEDRTAHVLGDATVNGGSADSEDSFMDFVNLASNTDVQDRLTAVGLDYPTSNIAAGNGGSYTVKGKYGKSTVTAVLAADKLNGMAQPENLLYLGAVPTDVAIAWDMMTDGRTDAAHGRFQMVGADDTTVWPDASTTHTVNVYMELK